MWDWLNTNAGVLSLAVSIFLVLIPLVITGIINMRLRKQELQFKKFEIYHDLIGRLVAPAPGLPAPLMDQQIAATYELRNFPEYYPLSVRILQGLKNAWTKGSSGFERLFNEMDLSIEYMNDRLSPAEKADII